MAFNANRLAGGVLGGLLITTVGIQWNFFVEGAAYIITALLLIPMRTPYQEVSTAREFSVLTNLKDGLVYIWRDNRIILHLMALSLILNLALMPIMALLPAYTTSVLHAEANVGGYLMAAQGVGGVTATVLIASLGFARKKGRLELVTLVVGSAAVLILAQSHWLLLSLAMLALLGVSQTGFIVINQILVQSMIPATLRGRVTSIYMFGDGSGSPGHLAYRPPDGLVQRFWSAYDGRVGESGLGPVFLTDLPASPQPAIGGQEIRNQSRESGHGGCPSRRLGIPGVGQGALLGGPAPKFLAGQRVVDIMTTLWLAAGAVVMFTQRRIREIK